MNPDFPTRTLYVTHAEFAWIHETIVKYSRFDDPNQWEVVKRLQGRFGLKLYTNYRVIVESGS